VPEQSETQKKYFDKYFRMECEWRDQDFSESEGYFLNKLIEGMLETMPKNILEIGCGNGLLTYFLLKQNLRITAVDISEKAIGCMRKQFGEEIKQKKLRLECADILEFLEKPGEKYDAVVGSGIIHHIGKKDWKKLFQSVRGRLNYGGIFICGPEPNAGGLYALAWPFAGFFYRIFGMDFDWEVEKGSLDMIPKNLVSVLKAAGLQEAKILPFQTIPHFHSKFLEYIDKKLVKFVKGKHSLYIIIKGRKNDTLR